MQSFLVDHSFHIGEQHRRNGKPCQDYALSGSHRHMHYAIVSDGCSSGGHTDIGARLVTLATKNALDAYDCEDEVGDVESSRIAKCRDKNLSTYQDTLKLALYDLLATNLWAVAQDHRAVAHIGGDGVLAIVTDTETYLHHFAWQKNAPFYAAYNNGACGDFEKLYADVPAPLIETVWRVTDVRTVVCEKFHTLEAGMEGITVTIPMNGNAETCTRMIALFSDGVAQVSEMDWIDVVMELLAFKSVHGSFAVRRMNRFLKDAEKNGNLPIDDIAYAAIVVDP